MSYFENIPSLQFSANALTVAHVIVSIFQKRKHAKDAHHTNHRFKSSNSQIVDSFITIGDLIVLISLIFMMDTLES